MRLAHGGNDLKAVKAKDRWRNLKRACLIRPPGASNKNPELWDIGQASKGENREKVLPRGLKSQPFLLHAGEERARVDAVVEVAPRATTHGFQRESDMKPVVWKGLSL